MGSRRDPLFCLSPTLQCISLSMRKISPEYLDAHHFDLLTAEDVRFREEPNEEEDEEEDDNKDEGDREEEDEDDDQNGGYSV
jgi:hypothetical protein